MMSFNVTISTLRTTLALVATCAWLQMNASGQTSKADATPTTFRSAEHQTHLVELYTSEGCSSCPPAEDWLSKLQSDDSLWKDFVPVAFHVDYWDGLGWPDKFASEKYTSRQRGYAHLWHSDSVYTPGFVLDGKEWQVWFSKRHVPEPSTHKAGVLTATATPDGKWNIAYSPADTKSKAWDVYVALLGGGYKIPVKAGENRGRNLAHDFVALGLVKASLSGDKNNYHASLPLPQSKITGASRTALAVWVCHAGELTPVQATGGWLSTTSP